jgi:pyruvate,water dikinase
MKDEKSNQDYTKWFKDIHITDVPLVGGKNASLGEMYNALTTKGVKIPNGFCVTVASYWEFIHSNKLFEPLSELMKGIDKKEYSNLREIAEKAQALINDAVLPESVVNEILDNYNQMCKVAGYEADVAVRSSATAEDLPSASFAGQHDSYLNIRGIAMLLYSIKKCFASLFNERAIKYREDNSFEHMKVGLSVGVQNMVRSDKGSSGVAFTLEPESGFRDIILISGSWGLGENVVQGTVNPDEFYVFKPKFKEGKNAIVNKKLGSKAKTMIYIANTDHQPGASVSNIDTPDEKRELFILNDTEINVLASWALLIEEHYKTPMDIEWAKDGLTGELYIVQARPETVHVQDKAFIHKEYILKEKGKKLVKGSAIGNKIASGKARIINSPAQSDELKEGEILVTDVTNPDWDVILKKASAIITNKGGRTSHASIVARELGIAAIVGTGDATSKITDGQMITVSCSEGEEGFVYDGKLKWEESEINLKNIKMPKTQPMLILGDPDKAFSFSFYPNRGIGLMRLEFIISNTIQVHPMALIKFNELKDKEAKATIERLTHHYPDKAGYFVEKLAYAVATIACAFYPKDVIVRMSDFKTNEYANLIGGKEFEPREENPMIGFRGASRYYDDRYKEGFKLECKAMKMVRDEMGLTNVKLMIPFCRTVDEGKKVVAVMAENGLKRGDNGLEIYVMAEIPNNILLAEEFAKIFDGFSIGSNDLTQLTLGIDRDNSTIHALFNEKDAGAEQMVSTLIKKAKKAGVKVGLCGQAPSDFPEYAQFLVEHGIDSISFNPDALLRGIENINNAEAKDKLPRYEKGQVN